MIKLYLMRYLPTTFPSQIQTSLDEQLRSSFEFGAVPDTFSPLDHYAAVPHTKPVAAWRQTLQVQYQYTPRSTRANFISPT